MSYFVWLGALLTIVGLLVPGKAGDLARAVKRSRPTSSDRDFGASLWCLQGTLKFFITRPDFRVVVIQSQRSAVDDWIVSG